MAAGGIAEALEENYLKLNLAGTRTASSIKAKKERKQPRRNHERFTVPCPCMQYPDEPLVWNCAYCGNELEMFYQEDQIYFSCYCSDRNMLDFYGICHHIIPNVKISFPESAKVLVNSLPHQREQRVIILLGETGVGKSTTINHLITSVTYKTWDEARKEKCVDVVPVWNFVKNRIMNKTEGIQLDGWHTTNEKGVAGKSATSRPVTYSFLYKYEGKEYLMMIMDTAGNNDTTGSKEIEDKHHLNIVEQAVALKSISAFCFIFGSGGQRDSDKTPNVMKVMKTILNPGFESRVTFLQTNSSEEIIEDIEAVITQMSTDLNLSLETEKNIFPIQNTPYLSCLTDHHRKKRSDISNKYGNEENNYEMSQISFKKLIEKAIINEKFNMQKEDIQNARIRKFGQKALENIFERALQLSGIHKKENLELEEKKIIEMEEILNNLGKQCNSKVNFKKLEKTFEFAKEAIFEDEGNNVNENAYLVKDENSENTTNPKPSTHRKVHDQNTIGKDVNVVTTSDEDCSDIENKTSKSTSESDNNGNAEISKNSEFLKVYEGLEKLINAKLTKENIEKIKTMAHFDSEPEVIEEIDDIKDNENYFESIHSPTVKEMLKEIFDLLMHFEDDKYFYTGSGLAILGAIGIGAGATMYIIPPVIPFLIYGGTGISGGVVTTTGLLAVILNHLKIKKKRIDQSKTCIEAVIEIDEYCKSIKCEVNFDCINRLKEEITKNSNRFIPSFIRKFMSKHSLLKHAEKHMESIKSKNIELKNILKIAETMSQIGLNLNFHHKSRGKELFVDWRTKSKDCDKLYEIWNTLQFRE